MDLVRGADISQNVGQPSLALELENAEKIITSRYQTFDGALGVRETVNFLVTGDSLVVKNAGQAFSIRPVPDKASAKNVELWQKNILSLTEMKLGDLNDSVDLKNNRMSIFGSMHKGRKVAAIELHCRSGACVKKFDRNILSRHNPGRNIL